LSKIEGVYEGILPCRFGQILQPSKPQNAETARQKAFVDHLLDFGPGEIKNLSN
jgi:hypothetical protein